MIGIDDQPPAVGGGDGSFRKCARHDRQHADGRRQPAVAEPRRAHRRQAGGPEPVRLGQGSHRQVDDRARREERQLQPGQTIIEPSSGNTGIALAAIARMKGYPIKILMPYSVSIERRQMLEVFGAEVILTPGEEGSNGAVRRAQEMADAASRVVLPVPVRQRRQPAGPLRGHRARRSGAIAPRSPTSSPAWAPAAR